ncbi:MAG: RNB domain-containing ribonuclease [Bacilli bacterium]
MESEIIELLSIKKNNNLKVDEIASILGKDKEEVQNTLRLLGKEGIVYKNNNDRYILVSNTSLKKGTIKITARKGAIVVLDDGTELDVVYKDKSKLSNNDTVLVEAYNQSGTAKVVKIINRRYYDYVGEVVKEGKNYIARCDGKIDIYLRDIYPIGTRLLIDGEYNTVKEVIGHKDDPGALEREVLALNGFPIEFSREYLDEISKIEKSLSEEDIENQKRRGLKDQRGIISVTIDGEDTKDFDDAVAYHNNTIYVQIADPNRYIKEKGTMWDETLKRAISVYFPGCCNPMMHEILSNGICSLVPGEDRYSVSMSIKMDDSGKVLNYKINEAVINNRKRMTYEDVNKYLEEGTIVDGYEDYTELIDNLYDSAMKVKNKMLREGFLEFTSDEVKFFFENSNIVDVKERHQGKAEELIEFLMLLHNMCMTDFFLKNKLPFISRFHDSPNNDKLNVWINLLKRKGYNINTGKKKDFTASDIKEVQKIYADCKEKVVYDKMAIMSQSKAKYSAYNIGHFALGMGAYSTGTSPIRRLADTINQRVLKDAIHYGVDYARKKWEKIMPYIARIATDAELRAIRAERKLDDIRKAEFMKQYEKQYFDVIVAGIYDNYMLVLYPDKMIYGKIYFNGGYFHPGKDGVSLMGKNGEKILIGDIINAKLLKTNIITGEITFFMRINDLKECNYEEKKGKKKVKSR